MIRSRHLELHLSLDLRRGAALAAAIMVPVALAACETTKGVAERPPAMQKISIDTPGAAGAQCSLSSVVVGQMHVTTPASIEVDRSPEIIVVRCRKPCFLDASAMISSEGQRLRDGTVIYSYPAATSVPMEPAASCASTAAGNSSPARRPAPY